MKRLLSLAVLALLTLATTTAKDHVDGITSATSQPSVQQRKPALHQQQRRSIVNKSSRKRFTDVGGLRDMKGKQHRLSDYVGKGNYVLVDVWASWCGPCMREMPEVKECYKKYKRKGFTIVGVSLDDKDRAWKDCIKNNRMNWIHLTDYKGWYSTIVNTYRIQGIPYNFLCDPRGNIIAENLHRGELEMALKEVYSRR